MTAETIPDDVQALLRERIRSFEELETLLLVRSQRGETWEVDAVEEKLHISSSIAEEALEQLCARGLVTRRTVGLRKLYQYGGSDPTLEAVVERFARAYQENRIEVMRLMTSNAVERLRGSAIKTFADAFLVGRKKDG